MKYNNYIAENYNEKEVNTHSWYNCKECGVIPQNNLSNSNDTTIISKKVRVFPTQQQHMILDKWMEIGRIVYNYTIKYFNRGGYGSFYTVRNNLRHDLPKHINNLIISSKIHSHIVCEAIHHAVSARKSALTNYKNGNIKLLLNLV